MRRSEIALIFGVLAVILFSSCMIHRTEFSNDFVFVNRQQSSLLAVEADSCAQKAFDSDSLNHCISLYEKAAAMDGENYHARKMLGNLYLLLGDGYEKSTAKKADHFQKALKYSEQAMYINDAFRKRVNGGEQVWQACTALSENELDAMVFWVTAIFYYYKECLGPFGQMINLHWIKRARSVLSAAEKLNPKWGGGIIYLSWGLYYLSIPEIVGGDIEKSTEYFTKAVAAGPHHLLNRWARGKYYHVKTGDREKFEDDLRSVLSGNAGQIMDHPAWKHYLINDAKKLLKNKEKLF